MVIRGTPKDASQYIVINNDDIIYQLSIKGIFPKYIDNIQAYFNKRDITLDIVNEIIKG
jgi:hypothetical protein